MCARFDIVSLPCKPFTTSCFLTADVNARSVFAPMSAILAEDKRFFLHLCNGSKVLDNVHNRPPFRAWFATMREAERKVAPMLVRCL